VINLTLRTEKGAYLSVDDAAVIPPHGATVHVQDYAGWRKFVVTSANPSISFATDLGSTITNVAIDVEEERA
jgi:3D (Asp-Asp-Asp) domain-containing protein